MTCRVFRNVDINNKETRMLKAIVISCNLDMLLMSFVRSFVRARVRACARAWVSEFVCHI